MDFNGAQLHLLLNHFPVIGFVLIIPALLYAFMTKSREVTRFALVSTTVIGFSSLFALQSGEAAEETIEDMPGVQSELIHEHEEAAEVAAILAMFTGIAAALGLFIQHRWPETLFRLAAVVFLLCILSAVVMGNAAHAGGLIRHPELRSAS